MRQNGITAFCDMYFFEDRVAAAAREAQMQVVVGEGIMDLPTPSAKNSNEGLLLTEKLLKKYQNDPYVKVAVAPHSIYTTTADTLKKAKNLAQKYSALFHLHLAETKKEFDDCYQKNRCSPVAFAEKLGLLDKNTLLAHCVWVNDDDIKLLAKRKVNVAHCPLSNLKLGSGIAPIAKMLKAGINVAIGTDGAASSNRLDIWEAGKFAALLQKGISGNPSSITAADAVKMMTINGIKALGLTKVNGKTIAAITKTYQKNRSFNYLYSLNSCDIDFDKLL